MKMPAEETKLDVGNYGSTSNPGEPAPEWRWRSVVLAIVGQWCCFICGVPAVVASLASYTDHRNGDFVNYRLRKRWAIKLAIAAIIFGIIVLIIQIWWLVSNAKQLKYLISKVDGDQSKTTA